MKNRPLHENLDTSFVNLSALARHLRNRKFAGTIRVELKDYEADIILAADGAMKTREFDRAAGRVAEGDEALRRLLIRVREPGVIHVFEAVEEHEEHAVKTTGFKIQKVEKTIERKVLQTSTGEIDRTAEPLFVQNIKLNLPDLSAEQNGRTQTFVEKKPAAERDLIKAKPPMPFEFTNRVEDKARQNNLSPADWRTLLDLIAELLTTIGDDLAKANLDFAVAFDRARVEISVDYPFLSPKSNVFNYKNGIITMNEQANAKIFVAGINETLRRLLDKLAAHPKFSHLYRALTQNILALINARKPLYDKFSITPQLEKTIGG